MAAIVHNNAVHAFELARAQQHTPYKFSQPQAHDSDSDSASSIGCDEHIAYSPVKAMPIVSPTVVASTPVVPRVSRAEMVKALSHAMSFLPLEAIQVARTAAPVFAEAADWVAPQPLGRLDATFIRWEPTEVPRPFRLPMYRRPAPGMPSNFSWLCLSCNNYTNGPRACSLCRAPVAQSSCRVFLGQLRKDLTAELTAYMLRSVAPELNILHIESHTNPTDGRGRGCAWVYVGSVEDAVKLTSLHKRIFVDVDADGNEGFWYVENDALIAPLAAMAESVGSIRTRPMFLPRQPMVAELPGKSMLAEVVSRGF